MQATENFNGKIFLNPVPTDVMQPGSFFRVMRKFFQKQPESEPAASLGPFACDETLLKQLPPTSLRVTWLGHSTLLIETGGKRFLTDPVWYNRVSPFDFAGPKRFFQNPVSLSSLPPIDAVLLSHDHYDHLDKQTILQLAKQHIPIITMMRVGRRLVNWGIPKALVTELDWWQATDLGNGFVVTATPSRHFSGRWLTDRFTTLWGAFAIKSPTHNIFFGADSGYYNGFTTIGERLGPFDIAMLEIGAYNEEWEAIHMGPKNAVQAALDLGNPLLLPIHWGTFKLAMHPWKEPVEQLQLEAERKNVRLVLPAPGETITIGNEAYNSQWWTRYR
jgi:L-ascorbate metabolism protein UlaG (beta-lactamase superfamily)